VALSLSLSLVVAMGRRWSWVMVDGRSHGRVIMMMVWSYASIRGNPDEMGDTYQRPNAPRGRIEATKRGGNSLETLPTTLEAQGKRLVPTAARTTENETWKSQ
jgi:hypothetical protein